MVPDDYQPPTLTVDNVIFQLKDNILYVLLGKITSTPYFGEWALPGGFCSKDETTKQASERVLSLKAGIDPSLLSNMQQLHTFDAIASDERGHVVSVVYMGIARDISPAHDHGIPRSTFTAYDSLPFIAYDQLPSIEYGLSHLKQLMRTTNIAVSMLPEQFTLHMLLAVYETVFATKFNKPNFRKRFLSYGVLQATESFDTSGAHRPARLYHFKNRNHQQLDQDFTA